MRDPNRIPRIMQKLQTLWFLCPDYRLGQLVITTGPAEADLFYTEDDKWEQEIDERIKELQQTNS